MADGGKTILIVDDDPDIVASTRIVLEASGFKVESAPDTQAARGKIREAAPALIILDIMMEGKGAGIIFARELRRNPDTAGIPVLMITGVTAQTGFSFPGQDKGTKWLPVDDYLEKPVDPKVLVEKIQALLGKSR